MTNENAIKYLKQLYPNGGHCWLDEQRIEAIGIAISAIEFKEKVRAEIERRMNELYNKLPDGNEVINGAVTIPDANITGKYTALESLLSFIDSMQLEEIPPKFPIISSKEELKQKPFKVEKSKWYVCIKDYHDKNCTFTKGKNYKSDKDGFLVDDEDKDTFERKIWEEDACEYFRPIKCMYTKDNFTDEDRKILCEDCEEKCEYSKKEEPVSEELEEASKKWLIPQLDKSYANYGEGMMMELTHFDGYAMLDAIEFGAKWQKLQDMGITNKAQDVVDDVLSSADSPLDAYATEVAFMMLPATLKESYHQTNRGRISDAVRLGAKWQKEKEYTCYEEAFEDGAKWKVENLWKPADGDDLPEIDREVVVFTQNFPNDVGMMSVAIAHRPNPDGWDGKSLRTGKVEHYTPKTYDKGGWNIPNVKWWLDCNIDSIFKRNNENSKINKR